MKLYNEEIKRRFLELYDNPDTRRTIEYTLVKAYDIETVLEKDLYNFNIDEIAQVLYNSSPSTFLVARTRAHFIENYISWAIENGYRDDNLNPLHGVDKSWFEQFIVKGIKKHFSEDELLELVESFHNAQDQALIWLLFEGVMGKGTEELLNLNYNDVDWNSNKLTLRDGDEVRVLKVSDRCMRYIENAYKEQVYYIYDPEEGVHREYSLLNGEYIFRNTESRNTKSVKLTKYNIHTRLRYLRDEHDLEILTPNLIRQSGMIKMAHDLYLERGKLEKEEFKLIGDRYNLSKIKANGYEYYNTTAMKQYINSENLKELYGLDVEI